MMADSAVERVKRYRIGLKRKAAYDAAINLGKMNIPEMRQCLYECLGPNSLIKLAEWKVK